MSEHPLNGSWIANIERSQRDPNHQFDRATMRFEVAGQHVSITYGGISAAGRAEHGSQQFQADERENPVPQAQGVVLCASLTSRSVFSVVKRDAMEIGRSAYEVAEDGRSMTATVSGIDSQGKQFSQVIHFDREPH